MSSEMLAGLIEQTEKLGELEIQIASKGVYPDRKRTKVQNVAVYQNDGTEHIKASHFVERSARQHREWRRPLQRAVGKWLSGDELTMNEVGRRIARDINRKVDRIKTGRLRHSFIHKLIKASR